MTHELLTWLLAGGVPLAVVVALSTVLVRRRRGGEDTTTPPLPAPPAPPAPTGPPAEPQVAAPPGVEASAAVEPMDVSLSEMLAANVERGGGYLSVDELTEPLLHAREVAARVLPGRDGDQADDDAPRGVLAAG